MGFFVYDTYSADNFFKKVTNFFLESFNTRMKVFLKDKKIIQNIKNTQEYKNFSPFLCNHFSECPCNYKSVILSNIQMRIFLSYIDAQYDHASKKGDSGLAILLDAKFKNLKGTADFDYLYAVDDAGNIINFANAVVRIRQHLNNNIPETQTTNTFFDGIINSIGNNDTIHYIANERLFPVTDSPDYHDFSNKYTAKKGENPGYCSAKSKNCDCELLKKITFIMSWIRVLEFGK